jgi:hypothetical protein
LSDDEGQDNDTLDAAIATTTGVDDDSSSVPGIVKTAYLGGVVGFPTPSNNDEDGEVVEKKTLSYPHGPS